MLLIGGMEENAVRFQLIMEIAHRRFLKSSIRVNSPDLGHVVLMILVIQIVLYALVFSGQSKRARKSMFVVHILVLQWEH